MRKYDRKEIMKKAWEIKRKLDNKIGVALKMAWVLAKKAVSLKEEYDRPEGKVEFNLWFKFGKIRAYYNCSWKSKYSNSKGCYIDLVAA